MHWCTASRESTWWVEYAPGLKYATICTNMKLPVRDGKSLNRRVTHYHRSSRSVVAIYRVSRIELLCVVGIKDELAPLQATFTAIASNKTAGNDCMIVQVIRKGQLEGQDVAAHMMAPHPSISSAERRMIGSMTCGDSTSKQTCFRGLRTLRICDPTSATVTV